MTTYRWKLTTHFNVMGSWRVHKAYDFQIRRDAEKVAREYVSGQKGLSIAHKAEIVQISTGRLQIAYYQDSFLGLLCWESSRMSKDGHNLPAETFTSQTFDRLIDRYHEIFSLQTGDYCKIRPSLPKTATSPDPETLAETRASLPETIVSFYLATFHMNDLVLYDAAGAVFDWLSADFQLRGVSGYVILTYKDRRPWNNRVFRSRKEMIETAAEHEISGQGYELTPLYDLDFAQGERLLK